MKKDWVKNQSLWKPKKIVFEKLKIQKNGLHYACENGKIEVVKFFIEKGIDLNTKDDVIDLKTRIESNSNFGLTLKI